MADGLCGLAASNTTTAHDDDGSSISSAVAAAAAAPTVSSSKAAINNKTLMDNNCQVKISEKILNDQKTENISIINSVCVMNERAETQKCEKNMSDAIKCPPSVIGATSLTALRKKKNISAGSVVSASVMMTSVSSDKQQPPQHQKMTGPNGLIKQPPPLHTAKDIDDIRKKRRCTDRYDSSESSDR